MMITGQSEALITWRMKECILLRTNLLSKRWLVMVTAYQLQLYVHHYDLRVHFFINYVIFREYSD